MGQAYHQYQSKYIEEFLVDNPHTQNELNLKKYLARLDKFNDLKKAHKDFKKFIKSRIVADQIKDDCPWSKEDDNKRKKKMYGNVHIDEDKFRDIEDAKYGFDEGTLQHDREQMLLDPNIELTTKNKKLLAAINKVNTHLKNIVK